MHWQLSVQVAPSSWGSKTVFSVHWRRRHRCSRRRCFWPDRRLRLSLHRYLLSRHLQWYRLHHRRSLCRRLGWRRYRCRHQRRLRAVCKRLGPGRCKTHRRILRQYIGHSGCRLHHRRSLCRRLGWRRYRCRLQRRLRAVCKRLGLGRCKTHRRILRQYIGHSGYRLHHRRRLCHPRRAGAGSLLLDHIY